MRLLCHSMLILMIVFNTAPAFALEITHVAHSPHIFIPEKNKSVAIQFTVSEDCDAKINIYDDRDILIRKLEAKGLKAGQQKIEWDGKDMAGQPVPQEAYRYTIVAENKEGMRTEHDFTDYKGFEQYTLKGIQWKPIQKQFIYTLKKPSRVFIRVGLDNQGPLLATVLNWVPRTTGAHKQHWDGMDTSGVLDLSKHPKLVIHAQAYTLPDNTILVGPPPDRSTYIKDISWPLETRSVKKTMKKRIYAPYQQSPETRGDYVVRLKLPDTLKKTSKGVPVVSGMLPILLDVDKEHRKLAVGRRSEPVFYIDGEFSYENEVGFLPMTWKIDTTVLNEGEHYLSVNLRGYEGNFGIATVKVFVEHE